MDSSRQCWHGPERKRSRSRSPRWMGKNTSRRLDSPPRFKGTASSGSPISPARPRDCTSIRKSIKAPSPSRWTEGNKTTSSVVPRDQSLDSSVLNALSALGTVADYLGLLGYSLKYLLSRVEECTDNSGIMTVLREQDNEILLEMVKTNLDNLANSAIGVQQAKLFRDASAKTKMLTDRMVKGNCDLDIDSIALMTVGKEGPDIIKSIRNSFESQGVEPNTNIIIEIYQTICEKHNKMNSRIQDKSANMQPNDGKIIQKLQKENTSFGLQSSSSSVNQGISGHRTVQMNDWNNEYMDYPSAYEPSVPTVATIGDSWMKSIHLYDMMGSKQLLDIRPHCVTIKEDWKMFLRNSKVGFVKHLDLSQKGLTFSRAVQDREKIRQWANNVPVTTIVHLGALDFINGRIADGTQTGEETKSVFSRRVIQFVTEWVERAQEVARNKVQFQCAVENHRWLVCVLPDLGEFEQTGPNSLSHEEYKALRRKNNQAFKMKSIKLFDDHKVLMCKPKLDRAGDVKKEFAEQIISGAARLFCERCKLKKNLSIKARQNLLQETQCHAQVLNVN